MKKGLDKIKKAVELEFGIKDLAVKDRDRCIVYSRSVYVRLCREFTSYSYSEIGKSMNRDHSTAIHNNKLFNEYIGNPYINDDFTIEYKNGFERISQLIVDGTIFQMDTHDSDTYYMRKHKEALLEIKQLKSEIIKIKSKMSVVDHPLQYLFNQYPKNTKMER